MCSARKSGNELARTNVRVAVAIFEVRGTPASAGTLCPGSLRNRKPTGSRGAAGVRVLLHRLLLVCVHPTLCGRSRLDVCAFVSFLFFAPLGNPSSQLSWGFTDPADWWRGVVGAANPFGIAKIVREHLW